MAASPKSPTTTGEVALDDAAPERTPALPPEGPSTRRRPVVLLVDDEESFVDALGVGLTREGFVVEPARDGHEALERFERSRPDVVLLDVMLPKLSGLDVCRELRSRSPVPIVMVTAKRDEIDTVVGLEVGADDYVVKPFHLRELVARIRAVLRRVPQPADGDQGDILSAGGVQLDPERHEVVVRDAEVRLPLKEFELLELLLANAGRVVTRDVLIDRVWGLDYVGDTKTLDVHIKRLRARIEEDPSRPQLITTIRGVGYRFESYPR
jgi:two-component system, OmpR family, response regulator RegX3